jgi:hypothetical protein
MVIQPGLHALLNVRHPDPVWRIYVELPVQRIVYDQ